MRKNFCVLVLAGLFVIALSGFAVADSQMNNPIDKAFARDFEMAANTAEINYVSESYLNAWQAELDNVAKFVKKTYNFPEDRKRVDDYVSAYKKVAERAFDLEMLSWSDTESPPDIRSFGTGGPGASLSVQARIYKQATMNLILHFSTTHDSSRYKYLYNGKGAQLEKLREQYR